MIVTLKKGEYNMANVDDTFPIQAQAAGPDSTLLAIKGDQLLLVGITHTMLDDRIWANETYYTGPSSVEAVRYVTFNRTLLPCLTCKAKLHVRMQYLGVDDRGYVMLRPEDLIDAGLPKYEVLFWKQPSGYVHVNMRYLRFD